MNNRDIFLAWIGGATAVGSLFIIGVAGLVLGALVLIRRAVHAWIRHRRSRLDLHVQAALDARLVRPLEAVTEVLDLDQLEAAFRHSPLHDYYLDPRELHR